MARCRECNAELIADENWWPSFVKINKHVCINCAKEYRRKHYHKEKNAARCHQYYLNHKEEILARRRQYHIDHKKERATYGRQHRASHKEEIATRDRQYYFEHKEEIAARNHQRREERALCRRQHYLAHRQQEIARTRQWAENNPDKVREHELHRRAREANAIIGEIDTAAIYERDKVCVYCGSAEDLTIDHVIPLSRGGPHSQENLVVACRSCNCSKGSKLLEEWQNYKEATHDASPNHL